MCSLFNRLGFRKVKRVIIAIIGFTVLLLGIAMIVLPGPATVVIPVGLAILATEFLWAKRWLEKIKEKARKLKKSALNQRQSEKS